MMKTNLSFIIRRLWRQKLHTFSHLLGLTLGITVCLLIALFLSYEFSFDSYHQNAERTYRINQVWEEPSEGLYLDYGAPAPLAGALASSVPYVETVTSVYPQSPRVIEVSPYKRYNQEGILFAESTFMDVFDVDVVEGNPYETLRKPWHAVLTESTAKKFFGGEIPLGKTFLYRDKETITVGAIIKDLPKNSHLSASMLISYIIDEEYLGFNPHQWGITFGASTYVVLEPGIDPAALEAPLQAIYDQQLNTDPEDPEYASAHIQPLHRVHLEPQYEGGSEWVPAINPRWLWFFGAIGLIVLILACINFVNLSTAQSLMRAKEVAVRKTIGAARRQLIHQFLGEAFFLIALSAVLAILISSLVLPLINANLEKEMAFSYLFNPKSIAYALGGLLLTGFLTGLYPAWLISKFQPALSLKGRGYTGDKRSSWLRKGLVVTQFALSGAMLIALILISQQMEFFYNQNLGFDKDNVITFKVPDKSKIDVLTNELNKVNALKGITFTSSVPSELSHNGTDMHPTDLNSPERKNVNIIFGDDHYPSFFNFPLVAGRYYNIRDTSASSQSLARDQRFPRVLVNERLVEAIGFGTPEEALGKRFKIGWNGWQPEIVGVVENFITSSLHETIQPTIIFQEPYFYFNACVKIEANSNVPQALSEIRTAWETTFPKQFYDFEFLDDKIEAYYKSESQLLRFFKLFAGLAMLISCIGLWGLATHAAVQRTKEIGIRKVLGASTTGIVRLLSKDFLQLVGLSIIIAVPIAWYFTNNWLQNFAYRINIQWWVFVLAGILAMGIAFLTVSFQSIKAALMNPVESLRSE